MLLSMPFPTGDTEQLLLDLNDPNCFQEGWNVQWIRYMTDNFVNQVKIQGVGGPLDSWAVFEVPSWEFDPLDPFAYDATCDPTDLNLVGACVSVNQWTTVTNLNSTGEINLYYIALIYEDTGNGTVNFKTKECEGVAVCEPMIACPGDTTLECGDLAGIQFWLGEVEVTDCGFVYSAMNDLTDQTFPNCNNTVGTVTVTFHLEDSNGDPVLDGNGDPIECTADLTIEDTTDPVITCVDDKTIECDQAVVWDAPSATDVCDPNPAIAVVSTTPDLDDCGNGTMTRVWSATDCTGNSSTCAQVITIEDTTDPVITCIGDKTIECDVTPAFDDPSATDNCDDDPVIAVVSTTPGFG